MFTEEELNILIEMGDITDAEAEVLKQQRLADDLRKGIYRHKGRDVGSNLARAFSGIGAAGRQLKANKAQDEVSGMTRDVLNNLRTSMQKQNVMQAGQDVGGPQPQSAAVRKVGNAALRPRMPAMAPDSRLMSPDPRMTPYQHPNLTPQPDAANYPQITPARRPDPVTGSGISELETRRRMGGALNQEDLEDLYLEL